MIDAEFYFWILGKCKNIEFWKKKKITKREAILFSANTKAFYNLLKRHGKGDKPFFIYG